MAKHICSKCKHVIDDGDDAKCHQCGGDTYNFTNDDSKLKEQVKSVIAKRKELSLGGLIGGLNCVIINTEHDIQNTAVNELLNHTGLEFEKAFEDNDFITCVLKTKGSADFLIRSRKHDDNPFGNSAQYPKAKHLPNTRLETFIFETSDIKKYFDIQKNAGMTFLTDDIIKTDKYLFIQTTPSKYTNLSIGLIQWKQTGRDYEHSKCLSLMGQFHKPDEHLLNNIKELDHTATRVEAVDRDAAILEFMSLTNYNFDFSIYVKIFNSITNVARFSGSNFAMVFTSGISPYVDDETSGPTEKFLHNYGPRVHHMAFRTENIEDTFEHLKNNGMEFLVELVGSKEDGLKQTFTTASKNTMLVNEYIHRYGDFDGFFTKSNVTLLTGATDKQ